MKRGRTPGRSQLHRFVRCCRGDHMQLSLHHRPNFRLCRIKLSFVEMNSTPSSFIHHTPSLRPEAAWMRRISFVESSNTLPVGYIIVTCNSIPPSPDMARPLLKRITTGLSSFSAVDSYLSRMLRPMGLRVTKLASGLPVGGDLEYADEVTLGRAFEGRRAVDG